MREVALYGVPGIKIIIILPGIIPRKIISVFIM